MVLSLPHSTGVYRGCNSLIAVDFRNQLLSQVQEIPSIELLGRSYGQHQTFHVLFAYDFHLSNWERVTSLKLLLVRLGTNPAGSPRIAYKRTGNTYDA